MFKFEQVFQSYNGKSGCMCGCNGTYKLPTHTKIEDANAEVGYKAYDEENISNRSVKIALKKINEALNFVGPHRRYFNYGVDYNKDGKLFCAYIDDGDRTSVVYFTEGVNTKRQVAA